MNTNQLIETYYATFNSGDLSAFLALLDDHVIHDINQGQRQTGKAEFKKFMEHMNTCYKETIKDIVILSGENDARAAAEFLVEGNYIKTDNGFPPAQNQSYKIPAGAFFEIENGKIKRITNYYNVREWVKLISTSA